MHTPALPALFDQVPSALFRPLASSHAELYWQILARFYHLEFEGDIEKGALPPVAFYKPRRGINQHPSASDVVSSDRHIGEILQRLEKSPQWGRMAVIVTYDENGGFWDHVPPPTRDRWGPGTRVPTLVVSPFAKRGFIDHTPYDTTSILRLIEARFGLAPLTDADAKANSMLGAFDS